MMDTDLVQSEEILLSTKEDRVNLTDYLSMEHRHGIEMFYLNLDRSIKQSDSIEPLTDNESIQGISLTHNYLLQMPNFVADYTNLIEINANFNELYQLEFLLYQSDSNENHRSKSSMSSSEKSTFRPLIHPFLEHVYLSHNHIQSLPSTLHYLRFLRTLDLSHNYLHDLPSEFGSLEQLRILRLNHNHLIELPSTFPRLIHLERLDLSHNQFQSLDMIKNLMHLKYLHLNVNPLENFPRLLSSCSNLEEISFAQTNLNEITFEYFHEFSRLKQLDLSKNKLENHFFLMRKTHSWSSLERLHLQSNQLSNINSLLVQLKSLHYLDLSHNCFTRLPKDLPSNLTNLRLSFNQIEIQSDDCIHLKHIIHLDFDHNEIQHIPDEFLQCLQVQTLNLSFNPLGEFPDILLRLKSIEQFTCQNQPWKSLPSKDLFQRYFCRTLKILDLSHHQLTSHLTQLTVLKTLTHLNLSHNYLDELDEDFRLLTCLQSLKLGHNKFNKFPSWLYEMSNDPREKYIGETLIELHLNNNKIRSIPEDIIHMINLKSLDLSNNPLPAFPEPLIYLEQLTFLGYSQASGIHISTLPDNFDNLSELKRLVLSSNSFSELPSVIYNLSKLIYLDLSQNLLTEIEINRLLHLKTIRLDGNYFTSFPLTLYRLESFDLHDNPTCRAPPTDIHYETNQSTSASRFVEINDHFEQKLFEIYKQILLDYLPDATIERLLIRLKLTMDDVDDFRKNTIKCRRAEKIELLFRLWKNKRGSLANAETLYRLIKIIGDKRLLQHMQKANILARKIRI